MKTMFTLAAVTLTLAGSALTVPAVDAKPGIATARHLPKASGSNSNFLFGPAYSPGLSRSLGPTPQRFRHRGRHHRRHGWNHWAYLGYGYGDGDGYIDPIPTRDQFGYYFDGAVTFDGTQPLYHYDRGYPYEFYNGSPAGPATRAIHCRVQDVWDEVSRRNATVRVCTPD